MRTKSIALVVGKPRNTGFLLTDALARAGWKNDEFGLVPSPKIERAISDAVMGALRDAVKDAREIRAREVR